jgi:transposase
MQDKELYQHILGLTSPWMVRDVKLDTENQEIRVQVDHLRGTRFFCPEYQQELPCYDRGEERQWRHLDSFKVRITPKGPRTSNGLF